MRFSQANQRIPPYRNSKFHRHLDFSPRKQRRDSRVSVPSSKFGETVRNLGKAYQSLRLQCRNSNNQGNTRHPTFKTQSIYRLQTHNLHLGIAPEGSVLPATIPGQLNTTRLPTTRLPWPPCQHPMTRRTPIRGLKKFPLRRNPPNPPRPDLFKRTSRPFGHLPEIPSSTDHR